MEDGSSAGYFHSVDTNISFSPRYNPIINNLGSITQEETTLTFSLYFVIYVLDWKIQNSKYKINCQH